MQEAQEALLDDIFKLENKSFIYSRICLPSGSANIFLCMYLRAIGPVVSPRAQIMSETRAKLEYLYGKLASY